MAKNIKPLSTPELKQNLSIALLGQAIRARRTQSNLRLEDAATLCGVAKQTLMNINFQKKMLVYRNRPIRRQFVSSKLNIRLCVTAAGYHVTYDL